MLKAILFMQCPPGSLPICWPMIPPYDYTYDINIRSSTFTSKTLITVTYHYSMRLAAINPKCFSNFKMCRMPIDKIYCSECIGREMRNYQQLVLTANSKCFPLNLKCAACRTTKFIVLNSAAEKWRMHNDLLEAIGTNE